MTDLTKQRLFTNRIQTDKQAERQTTRPNLVRPDRQTDKQRGRKTDSHRNRQTHRQAERHGPPDPTLACSRLSVSADDRKAGGRQARSGSLEQANPT